MTKIVRTHPGCRFALLACCLIGAPAAEERIICAREPQVVPGVVGQALNFSTTDPGMFDSSNTAIIANGPRPFLAGPAGTVALRFKGEYLTKGHSVLFELGSHRDGMMEDCDGVIPAKSAWPGEGFSLVIKPTKAPGEGRVHLWGCAGGVDFGIDAPQLMDLKAWHHAALVWQPGSMRLYIDGALAGTAGTGQTNDFELARYVRLASDLYGGSAFNGALDDLQAFSRAFAPEEIAALAQGTSFAGDAAVSFSMPCDGDVQALVERQELATVLAGKPVFRAGLGQQRYASVGDPIPMTLSIPAGAPEEQYEATVSITAEDGKTVFQAAERFHRDPAAAVEKAFTTTLGLCGVYQLALTVKDSGGTEVFARSVRFAVIAKLPPLAEIPDSSPAGFWSDTTRTTLGFKWTRLWDANGCSWTSLEPRKGHYHWSYLDATVADITARGSRALLCITGTPAWASAMPKNDLADLPTVNADGYAVMPGAGWGGTASYPPTDLADFENFLRQLFRRYKGVITAYECWNEPDTSHYKGTPEQYVDMLKVMYRVLKEEDPTAILVGGVGSGYPPWTAKIVELGAAEHMDVLAIHPYCMIDPVSDYRKGQLGKFIAFHRGVEAKLGRPLPIWGDELGTTYVPLDKAEFIKKYGGETATPEGIVTTYDVQSIRWDLGVMLALVGMGKENKYFPGGTNNVHYDGKAVAFAALSKAVSFRTDARFIPVNDQALGVLIESAGHGPKRIAAIWGAGTAVFPMQVPQVEGMDMYGNPIVVKTEDGLLRLPLTGDVVYLFDVPADFASIQVASFTLPKDSTAGQEFAGELTVRNPYAHRETFGLEAKSPTGWRVGLPSATVTLEAGATLAVPLAIRSGPATGNTEIEVIATDARGNVFPSWNEMFNLAILPLKRYTGAVELAKEATWSGAPVLATIDSEAHINIGKPNREFPDMPQWRGPADLSYTVRGGWRDDGLYLWIEVVDDQVHPGKAAEAPWNMDGVELFIDFLNDKTLKGERTNTEQFVVIPSLGAEFAPCEAKLCDAGTNAKVQFVGRRTERGYIVAGKLFYRSYSKLRAGSWIGLDVKVDDCDDPTARETRKASMTWIGDEHNSSSSAKWGRFVLAE